MNNQNLISLIKSSCLIAILLLSMMSMGFKFPFWTPMVKAEAKPGDFEIHTRMLNGKNLPEFVKGAEASDELIKYLLVSIVNHSGKKAWFDLEITGKNNQNVWTKFTVNDLPTSNRMRTPVYYLQYIGAPVGIGEANAEETDFKYEIKKLYFG